MTLLFIMLFKRLVPRIPLAYFRPFPFQKLRDVLKIGLPSAAEQISYDASQVTIVYFINMLGNEYLTARVYVMNIVIIGYIFLCRSRKLLLFVPAIWWARERSKPLIY